MIPKHECPPGDTAWSIFRPHSQVAEGILEALPTPPGNLPAMLCSRTGYSHFPSQTCLLWVL